MLKIESFKSAKIASNKLNNLVGGWIDIIETPTGNVEHWIDDCNVDGQDLWSWYDENGQEHVSDSPQEFARNGDFG